MALFHPQNKKGMPAKKACQFYLTEIFIYKVYSNVSTIKYFIIFNNYYKN